MLQIATTETVRSDGIIYCYSDGIRRYNCSCGHYEGIEDSEIQLHKFSTSALNAELLSHAMVELAPRERFPATDWLSTSVGLSACLQALKNRNIF